MSPGGRIRNLVGIDCTSRDMKAVEKFEGDQLGRARIVDTLFEQLSVRPDIIESPSVHTWVVIVESVKDGIDVVPSD